MKTQWMCCECGRHHSNFKRDVFRDGLRVFAGKVAVCPFCGDSSQYIHYPAVIHIRRANKAIRVARQGVRK